MQRFSPEPPGPAPQEPLAAMAHRLKTREGRALYALRKSTVEPVIGIIKSVMKNTPLQPVGSATTKRDYPCVHAGRS